MAEFNRFDICDAHAVLEWDYNVGGWLRERPSNQRRLEATSVQLSRMQFTPSMDLSYANMSDNAKEIYRAAEARYGLRKQRIQDERHDLVQRMNALALFTLEEIVDFDRMTPNAVLDVGVLVWKLQSRSLDWRKDSDTNVPYDTDFENKVADLKQAVDDLADTLNWLFDEPVLVIDEPRTQMPIITAEYNQKGYALLVDGEVVYRAGNSAYGLPKVVDLEYAFPLGRIYFMAKKSLEDECKTRKGYYGGTKEVTELP